MPGPQLWAQEKDTPCGDFAVSWFLGQLLAFIAALVVAGMNGVLQVVLRRVVKAERHVSQSAEHAAFSHKVRSGARFTVCVCARAWRGMAVLSVVLT